MRYLSVTPIIFLFFLLVLPNAQEIDKPKSHNAYWWEEMPESFKLGYLAGFADAAYSVTFDSGMYMKRLINADKDTFTKEDLSEYLVRLISALGRDWFLGSGTFDQYRKGIDDLYEDYKNKSIPVDKLIYIVNLSLTGAPKEKIEEELRYLRENISIEKK